MFYYHVDVFSNKALAGNGLTVLFHDEDMETKYMQDIAKEFKQFETIFLKQIGERRFRTRIFTVEEELDFAGHPILGAAAAIHEKIYAKEKNVTVIFELNNKVLEAESIKKDEYFQIIMNQGIPEFLGIVEGKTKDTFLQALNLTTSNLNDNLPMEVVSTGLPYLIVPISSGLEQVKISTQKLEAYLNKVNAKFVYVFYVPGMEGRTWDNLGETEDVATGSAAGPTGAYLCKWGICKKTEDIIINQGRFVGRPSKIKVFTQQTTGEMKIVGDVKIVVKGDFLA